MTTFASSPEKIRVDIWSDIACPWCYIGKRRFEQALDSFAQREQVEVVYHSFELDPGAAPHTSESVAQHLAHKYGRTLAQAQQMVDGVAQAAAGEGLQYDFGALQQVNTFLSHQLIHFAAARGHGPQMKERLLHAHFTQGLNLSEVDVLAELAAGIGLNADEARAALESGQYAQAVRADEQQAQAYGITGVPFFVLGGKYGVSGAQNPEVFTQALTQVWAETNPSPLSMLGADDAEGCQDGSCAVPDKTS